MKSIVIFIYISVTTLKSQEFKSMYYLKYDPQHLFLFQTIKHFERDLKTYVNLQLKLLLF